jgi:hypothetical protein
MGYGRRHGVCFGYFGHSKKLKQAATTVYLNPTTAELHRGNDHLLLYEKANPARITMYNTRIALISRGIRVMTPAVQRPYAYTHACALSTVGPRAAASDPTRPTTTPGTDGPPKPQDRNALYIGGGGLVGLGAIWYYYTMREDGRTAKRQDGLGRQKVRAGFEGYGTRSIDDKRF